MEQKIKPYISVIIPAFNEADDILFTLNKIISYFKEKNHRFEIIVVDDGSNDKTSEVVKNLNLENVRVLKHESNVGKGAAVKTGMMNARGGVRMFLDADYQITIDNLDRFLPHLGDYDIVIGSTPPKLKTLLERRSLLGVAAKLLISLVMGWSIKDSQRGIKIFTQKAAEYIFPKQTIEKWGFDIEDLAIALEGGFRVKEISVEYTKPKKSNVSTSSYLQTLWELLKIKRNLFLGKYSDKRGYRSFIPSLVLFFVFGSLFLSQRIFFDGDTLSIFYPFAFRYDNAPIPLWDITILSGFPSPASFQLGFFNPLYAIAYRLFNYVTGYSFLVVFYFLAAFLLSYLFLRKINISREGSLLGAMAYTFSQFNMHWMGNIAVTASIILLPAVFLAVQDAFDNRRKYLFVFSIILAVSWSSAHNQLVILSLLGGAFYALYLIWKEFLSRKMVLGIVKKSFFLILSVLVGTALVFPQLFYSWQFSQLSTRVGGLSYALASVDAAVFLDWIKYILPGFGLRYATSGEFLPYIGFFPLILGFLMVRQIVKRRIRADNTIFFFAGLFIFSLIMAVKFSPLFWLANHVPILNLFRGPSRWMFIGNFAAAVLAGGGFDYAMAHWEQWRSKAEPWLRRFSLTIFGLALLSNAIYFLYGDRVIALAQVLFDKYWFAKTTGLPLGYYHQVLALIIETSFKNLSLLNYKFVFPVAVIFSAYAVVRYSSQNRNTFAMWVLGLSLLNFIFLGAAELRFADRSIITKPPEMAEFILGREKENSNYRIFSFLIGTGSSQKITAINGEKSVGDGLRYIVDGLTPNSNVYWNIPHIDGYEPIAPLRNQRILAAIGSESSQRFTSLANEAIPFNEKLSKFLSRIPLLSMMNTKYIISAFELPPTANLSLIHTASSTRFNIPLYLYENKKVLPRIYLANSVEYITETDEEKNFETVSHISNNFSKKTFIECQDCQDQKNLPSASDSITITEYKDGYVSLNTSITQGRWLIFSESNLPGWHITLDGKPTQSFMANYLYHGVYIPGGNHEIVFQYKLLKLLEK